MLENDLIKIIQNIKTILFNLQLVHKEKVYDKDVATMLRIPPNTLTTMKSRNQIPYKELMEFCFRNAVEVKVLFYGTVVVDRVGE